ncbi:hypothetical protein RQP46_005693 [Phenoliferia psychrophenolica]
MSIESVHVDSIASKTSDWDEESIASTTTAAPAKVNTDIREGRIPAFPFSHTKSAVFNQYKSYKETPEKEIKALEGRLESPYTLFTFENLQISGSPKGDESIAPRFMHNKYLPGSDSRWRINYEPLGAATVTIGGEDFAMVVLLDIARGARPELASALGVVLPLYRHTWMTFDVMASSAKGFFHDGHLILIHADLLPISRPWKHLR